MFSDYADYDRLKQNVLAEHIRASKNQTIKKLIRMIRVIDKNFVKSEGHIKASIAIEDFITEIELAVNNE